MVGIEANRRERHNCSRNSHNSARYPSRRPYVAAVQQNGPDPGLGQNEPFWDHWARFFAMFCLAVLCPRSQLSTQLRKVRTRERMNILGSPPLYIDVKMLLVIDSRKIFTPSPPPYLASCFYGAPGKSLFWADFACSEPSRAPGGPN